MSATTRSTDEILLEVHNRESEVLPSCPPIGKLEGTVLEEANTHGNAGGFVRKGTPAATLIYFQERFKALAAQFSIQ